MPQTAKAFVVCLALLACAAVIIYVGFDISGRAMQMEPAKTGVAEYQSAKAGTPIKIIVEIDGNDGADALTGHLLEPVTETTYRRTSAEFRAEIGPAMRVIMGTADDLKGGAIAQLDGVTDGRGTIQVRRAVILSAYVHVAAP
jgi:hypothetical protein